MHCSTIGEGKSQKDRLAAVPPKERHLAMP